jgi:hypothetical protein
MLSKSIGSKKIVTSVILIFLTITENNSTLGSSNYFICIFKLVALR